MSAICTIEDRVRTPRRELRYDSPPVKTKPTGFEFDHRVYMQWLGNLRQGDQLMRLFAIGNYFIDCLENYLDTSGFLGINPLGVSDCDFEARIEWLRGNDGYYGQINIVDDSTNTVRASYLTPSMFARKPPLIELPKQTEASGYLGLLLSAVSRQELENPPREIASELLSGSFSEIKSINMTWYQKTIAESKK